MKLFKWLVDMIILVPKSVDVKRLVAELNLSPTRSKSLKYKVYYFLSRVVSHNDNIGLNEENNGYRNICSKDMKLILGNRYYYQVLKLLQNHEDPIIETDQSWHNPNETNGMGYCLGYRLTEKYNTGEVVFKSLPSKFQERILKHRPGTRNQEELNVKFRFLLDQFKKYEISIDPMVYDYIYSVGKEFLRRIEDNNIYQTKLVYNMIGRWLYFIEKINRNEIWSQVSTENHRLSSSITSLKRELRPFLRVNGKGLHMADISSSQPYILSALMHSKFYLETGIGFNLQTIYSELFDELVAKGYISVEANTTFNNIDIDALDSSINGNLYQFTSDYTGVDARYTSSYSINPYSFMWCQFLSREDIESIGNYQYSPFDKDFYTYVLKSYKKIDKSLVEEDILAQRQKLKDTMWFVLFDDNIYHRYNNYYIGVFRSVFPGVNRWIDVVHRIIGKQKFAYLLQRAESYLVLDVVSREFNRQFPEAPIFTVHDAIFTYGEYVPELTRLLVERLWDITGVRVGYKIKGQATTPEPLKKDIDKLWSKIGKVKSERQYAKVKGGVFSSNVERGSKFLENFPEFFIGD